MVITIRALDLCRVVNVGQSAILKRSRPFDDLQNQHNITTIEVRGKWNESLLKSQGPSRTIDLQQMLVWCRALSFEVNLNYPSVYTLVTRRTRPLQITRFYASLIFELLKNKLSLSKTNGHLGFTEFCVSERDCRSFKWEACIVVIGFSNAPFFW